MAEIDTSGIVGLPFRTFPTGWFQVAWTAELARGGMQTVRYWNRDWVLWRTGSGQPVVTAASCLRRGEPLDVGYVDGEHLVCGVCQWRYDQHGVVRDAHGNVVNGDGLRTLPALDRNLCVFAWYDAKCEPPSFEVPTYEEVNDKRFYPMYPHGALTDVMRVHPQMVAENVADAVHIHYIHKWIDIPRIDKWVEDGATLVNVYSGQIPTARGPVDTTIENIAAGIGFMATRFWGLRDVLHFGGVTPIDPSHVQFRLSVWVSGPEDEDYSRSEPDKIAKAIYGAQRREVLGDSHDRPIWEHQRYMAKAAFRREERHYVSYRKWVQQFYPHDSDETAEAMAG